MMGSAPPLRIRWIGGVSGAWFYLDRAGPGGLGGWIAPDKPLELMWIEVQCGLIRIRAPLTLDSERLAGRRLYRFNVNLPLSWPAHVKLAAADKTLSLFVFARRKGAPIVLPAPPVPWRTSERSIASCARALVVLAPIDWSFRRQRSQQLTLALSKHYEATYYLGPASLRLKGAPVEAEERIVLPLLGSAPDLDFAKRRFSAEEACACSEGLSALLGNASVDVVVQFPSWRDVATRLKRARIVYDCIDDHARLPHVTTPLEGYERALAQEAELSLATSEALERRLTMLGARNVLRSPNAGVAPNPDAWPHYRDAAIVYLGAIEEWFDFTLLEAAAQAVPEAEVRVIGACNAALPRGLSRRIRFMGEMDHASAMRALSHARVGIIPFRRSALIDAVDPVKAYEYLAAGLPVVMTPMGAGHVTDAPGVSVANDAPSFRASVARAYGETQPTDRDALAAWARRETWDARAAAILARLRG
jgi:hypothetical protein